jgi:hypothetical protein
LAISGLGTIVAAAGSIIGQLAVNLASIENALEQAAHEAERFGVSVGPDGLPLPPSMSAQSAARVICLGRAASGVPWGGQLATVQDQKWRGAAAT